MKHRHPFLFCGFLLLAASQQSSVEPDLGRVDKTRAFYHPSFARNPDAVLADTAVGGIDAATYLRYLAARHGTEDLEDLAFDLLLEKECKKRRLARIAPTLARSLGTRRFFEVGRKVEDDPSGAQRRKFTNDALRQLRIDAIVRADRARDDWAVRALFERRYGVGGEKVRVRQILVSLDATKRRLGESDEAAAVAAAEARARALSERLRTESFEDLLGESDERLTRRMLRDPTQRAKAGFLAGYNFKRYGPEFADVVRGLEVGAVSAPVRTAQGFHLVQLVERTRTRFSDVVESLDLEMRRRQTTPTEVQALRRRLLKDYAFKPR